MAKNWTKWLDTSGAWMSGACAIHCGLWPVLAVTAPALWWEKYDTVLWTIAFCVSVASVASAWRTHQTYGPMICAIMGWVWAAVMFMWGVGHSGLWATGILLMVAHLWNKHRHTQLCTIHKSSFNTLAAHPEIVSENNTEKCCTPTRGQIRTQRH